MTLATLGIIGDTLYLDPFYGGDHYHEVKLSEWEKRRFLELGVKEYSDIDYIECQLFGLTYEQYMESREEALSFVRKNSIENGEYGFSDDLPF